MQVPNSYNAIIRVVASDATSINAEISTQNAAEYWVNDIRFTDASTCVMLFGKTGVTYISEDDLIQFVTAVDAVQVDIDADIATQSTGGHIPTGIFPDPYNNTLYICYANLGTGVDD